MVFNNNLLLGAAGSQGGVTPFDPTAIPKSVWLDGSADGLTIASSSMSAEDGKEFTLGTWYQLNHHDTTFWSLKVEILLSNFFDLHLIEYF